jgi:2-methylisocitrate lyase-like PEP mutase family enzyme
MFSQTGAGTAASRLGMPDIGLAGLSDMRAHAEMIANLVPGIPVIADMDTGYGGMCFPTLGCISALCSALRLYTH